MVYYRQERKGDKTMNNYDKRQIEKLKELKKEYLIVRNLTKEERVKRFCKAMKEERR